jgi:hypothetical protein
VPETFALASLSMGATSSPSRSCTRPRSA